MRKFSERSKTALIKKCDALCSKIEHLAEEVLTKVIIADCEKKVGKLFTKFPKDDLDTELESCMEMLDSCLKSMKERFINQVSVVPVYDTNGNYLLDDGTESFEDLVEPYPAEYAGQIDY